MLDMTGADLRAFRQRAALTQQDMADEIGLSLRQYQEVEAGKTELRVIHALAVEMVSLRLALHAKDIALALPSARRDALDYAALVRGSAG